MHWASQPCFHTFPDHYTVRPFGRQWEKEVESLEKSLSEALSSKTGKRIERQLFSEDLLDAASSNGNTHDIESGLDSQKKGDAVGIPTFIVQTRSFIISNLPPDVAKKLPSMSKVVLGYFIFLHLLVLYVSCTSSCQTAPLEGTHL
jgi:hypothetical protein